MRRSIAATTVLLALLAALVSGCASSSPATPDAGSAAAPAAPTAVPAAPSAAAGAASVIQSTPPITDPRPFPEVTIASAPPAVLDALKNKRAICLVYYDPAQSVTVDQREVMSVLSAKFKGLIEFIAYDLPRASVATTASEGKTAAQVAGLAQKLKVGFMPSIVMVTRDNVITWQSTGYQDVGPLEREILRATR